MIRLTRLFAPFTLALALIHSAPVGAQQPDTIALALLIGSCSGCHGSAGEGSGGVPAIAGTKSRDEFAAAMNAFRENQGNPTIMNRIARGYTDAEIAQMAQHFARAN
ncbi:c-type cytochrome [Elioraea sp.]|uniref:c-type cytochrome n=1 Tax=Elioraea sp. TaxID=2185103 RepID=UPI003F7061C2